jgi:hypothetical protein
MVEREVTTPVADADHENRCINDDHIEARNDQSAACR